MADLNTLLAAIKAADPSGGHYHDLGEVLVDVPEFLQVEYEAASSQAQAVAGRWEDGQLVEVIAWHPSGEPWTIESIDCGEDADSYGVPDNGWPCEDEDDEALQHLGQRARGLRPRSHQRGNSRGVLQQGPQGLPRRHPRRLQRPKRLPDFRPAGLPVVSKW